MQNYLVRSLVTPMMQYTILSDNRGGYSGGIGNKVTAEAIFQKCDDTNANGHSFPKNILMKALQQIKPEIENRHFLGELDHPEDINDVNRIATVSLKNASHIITELKMDGDYVVGKFETLETPNGLILGSLLKDRIKVGVSIRAVTDQDISYGFDKIDAIQNFTLISYDAVHNPAYNDAYVKSIMASVIKIPSTENNFAKKLMTITNEELRDIIQKAIVSTITKLHKK